MIRSLRSTFVRFALPLGLCLASLARAEWKQDDKTVAWMQGEKTVWSFTFDAARGKAFFEPLTINGGPSLTSFRPADHPHHYSLWFSWKYINRTNYWEESVGPGISAGRTSWTPPVIDTRPDGSATIRMAVTYSNRANNRLDMIEQREITVSAPDAQGSYNIDWKARFMAGPDGAYLDRTAMPGEPGGAVNGGYAGFSIRMASDPLHIAYLSTDGPITEWVSGRNRPNVPAVASNFTDGDKSVGGVAILSDPKNAGTRAPWYLINQGEMRFMCAAILAPSPKQIYAGSQFDLHYRVAMKADAWTPQTLAAAHADWNRVINPPPPAPAGRGGRGGPPAAGAPAGAPAAAAAPATPANPTAPAAR